MQKIVNTCFCVNTVIEHNAIEAVVLNAVAYIYIHSLYRILCYLDQIATRSRPFARRNLGPFWVSSSAPLR